MSSPDDLDVPETGLSGLDVELAVLARQHVAAEIFTAQARRAVVQHGSRHGLLRPHDLHRIALEEPRQVEAIVGDDVPFADVGGNHPDAADRRGEPAPHRTGRTNRGSCPRPAGRPGANHARRRSCPDNSRALCRWLCRSSETSFPIRRIHRSPARARPSAEPMPLAGIRSRILQVVFRGPAGREAGDLVLMVVGIDRQIRREVHVPAAEPHVAVRWSSLRRAASGRRRSRRPR